MIALKAVACALGLGLTILLGLKFEAPPRQVPNSRTKVAFLTDPWGTYIEVTEGLGPDGSLGK